MIKTYSKLKKFDDFASRYSYLRLRGVVGEATFGYDRYINQKFYSSREWKQVRDVVIVRDNGCDLGVEGYDIHDKIIIHHMNPMTIDNVRHDGEDILNPEFLISVSHRTHNAIHYGIEEVYGNPFVPRAKGDTALWPRITRR